ncbi:MAG: hypothetical protein NT156_06725 [Mycobacterium sp.]|nr:hypothetical protein [Mycobacterium sp.]
MDDGPLAAVLAAGAGVLDDPALSRLSADLSAPLRVGVCGRPGAGQTAVRRALRGAGLVVTAPGVAADVGVYVFTESLTPDDRAALADARLPTVAVLNKADLAGFRGDGPMVIAAARCRELQSSTGVPTRPLAALLAVAGGDPAVLDPELVAALQQLTEGSAGANPATLSPGLRRRLLAELDLFGIANAVAAVSGGADPAALAALFRQLSGLNSVTAEIDRVGALPRYRRLVDALAPLVGQSVGPRGAQVAEFLAGDAVVLARRAAAADVLTAAGEIPAGEIPAGEIPAGEIPDGSGEPDAALRRAISFQRYARGPVAVLHRACAADIVRGELRLWRRAARCP